jgi:hypothetical protein
MTWTDADYIEVAATIVYDFGRNNDWAEFVPQYITTYNLTADSDRLLEALLEEVTPRETSPDGPRSRWGHD